MQFKIKELKQLLTHLQIVPIKSTLPIISSILFADGFAQGTNLETYVYIPIETDAEPLLCSKSLLKSIVDNMTDSDLLDITKTETGIKFSSGTFILIEQQSNDVNDYPTEPPIEDKPRFSLDIPCDLYNKLKNSFVCASTDELRSSMTVLGISVKANGEIKAATTDGHKLSCLILREPGKGKKGKEFDFGLRKDLFNLTIDKDDSIRLNIYAETAELQYKDRRILTRLNDDTFPDYESIIPTYEKSISVNAVELRKALKVSEIIPGAEIRKVRIDIEKNILNISCSQEGYSMTTAIMVNGTDEWHGAVNSVIAREVLSMFNSDITLSFSDPLKALRIDNGFHTALIMPLRDITETTPPQEEPKEETKEIPAKTDIAAEVIAEEIKKPRGRKKKDIQDAIVIEEKKEEPALVDDDDDLPF